VFIEYCSNSEKTQLSTSHSEGKYIAFAKRFRQGIIEKFPQIKVYIKSSHNPSKVVKYTISKDPRGNIIDDQREPLRIGAFEISLAIRQDSFTRQISIYSKLKTNCFPNLSYILSRICEFVPKCSLAVNVCDNIKGYDEKLHPEKAEGMKVQLRLSFKDTKASEELERDIQHLELEKWSQTPQRAATANGSNKNGFAGTSGDYLSKRMGKMGSHRQSMERTYRPYSATTDFNPMASRNTMSRRNFSNRLMSSQHMMRQTPSMKSLMKRPQTAATHTPLKSSMSIGRLKTVDTQYGGPRTVANISTYSKSVKSTKSKKLKIRVEDVVFEAVVNSEGIAIFEEVPKTAYVINASENDFFKAATKRVCLPQELEKDGRVEVYLPLERQDAYTTTIYMLKEGAPKPNKEPDTDGYEGEQFADEDNKDLYYDNLQLRAILLELYDKKNPDDESQHSNDSDLESEVEFEEEFELLDNKYKCKLMPGRYMIVAKGPDIKEFSEIISIKEQITTLTFTPSKSMRKEVYVHTFNAVTGESLSNVLLRLRKCSSKVSAEGLTRDKGEFLYVIDSNSAHSLEVNRKGFIPYSFEFNQTKGNEHITTIKVPLFPIEKQKLKSIPNPENPQDELQTKLGLLRAVLVSDSEDSCSQMTFSLYG
jgi:hypothetical protein